jgi:hypothetical protein
MAVLTLCSLLKDPPTITPCLRDLRITDPRDDKERIKESKDRLLKDCYAWILEKPEFRRGGIMALHSHKESIANIHHSSAQIPYHLPLPLGDHLLPSITSWKRSYVLASSSTIPLATCAIETGVQCSPPCNAYLTKRYARSRGLLSRNSFMSSSAPANSPRA